MNSETFRTECAKSKETMTYIVSIYSKEAMICIDYMYGLTKFTFTSTGFHIIVYVSIRCAESNSIWIYG